MLDFTVIFQYGRRSVVFQKDFCWDQNSAMSLSLCISDLVEEGHSEISVDDANFSWLAEYNVSGTDLGERTREWQVSFSVAKCKVLPERNNNLTVST